MERWILILGGVCCVLLLVAVVVIAVVMIFLGAGGKENATGHATAGEGGADAKGPGKSAEDDPASGKFRAGNGKTPPSKDQPADGGADE